MKIAVAGKGGVGKTTITAWFADYLARRWGKTVWMVDADTALSLGQACGISKVDLPQSIASQKELIAEYIRPAGSTILSLTPDVTELLKTLFVTVPIYGSVFKNCIAGEKRLLVMGAPAHANSGCACESNALLKALLAQLVFQQDNWVLVDLEAGVEHLGRGTVAHVDQLIIVAEPSYRSLEVAAEIGRMAHELGLEQQHLIINQAEPDIIKELSNFQNLPQSVFTFPHLNALKEQQFVSGSVFGMKETIHAYIDNFFHTVIKQ